MATYQIPKECGTCRVITARAGNPLVTNDRTGKNKVLIPCTSHEQAQGICDLINRGEHNGTVHA
jgi:hypothetical protein